MTTREKSTRLGHGELAHPALTADHARLLLLETLETLRPPLELVGLQRDALPHAGTSGEAGAVAEWARRHSLDVPWVREQARETLQLWLQFPKIAPSWGVTGTEAHWAALSRTEMRITIHDSWMPEWETRDACRSRVVATLDTRLAEIQRLAGLRGLKPVKVLRTRKGVAGWAFKAFVLYQCRGCSQAAIARTLSAEHPSRSRVAKAVADVAHLTGIPLRRPQRGGRPEEKEWAHHN